MKKAKLLLLTLLAIIGYNTVQAETVSPYTADFNSAIFTSQHDFAVASNWGHIVGSYEGSWGDTYYMSYTYYSDQGIDGSGTLLAYKQFAGESSYDGETIYDLLVTPVVSGEVSLYVKKSISASANYPAFVEFYSLNDAGTARSERLSRIAGDDLNPAEGEEWTKVTIQVDEAQKIGIRAQFVYIDNFTATSADIVAEKKLTITGLSSPTGSTPVNYNQKEDGTVDINMIVKLKNNGDVDLKAGSTENYTLTFVKKEYWGSTETAYENAIFNIPKDIAVGAELEFEATFTLSSDIGTGYFYGKVRENISGTVSSATLQSNILEYASKFIFDVSGSTYYSSSSSTKQPIAFGKIKETTTLNYEIYNSGSAPLTINSLSVVEPFTTNAPTSEFTVAAGEKKQITFTLPADNYGVFTGDLTIEYTNYGKEKATYTLEMSGTVIDPSKNLITFDNGENGQFPVGSIHSDEVYISSETTDDATNYFLQSTSKTTKFITPKLTAEAGESFTFDTWYKSYSSTAAVKVYTSTDRQNWTEVKSYAYPNIGQTLSTCTVTLENAGDYYLAFELIGNALLDNIYGLTLAPNSAHDWYLVKSDIPATGKQNYDYTAKVDVQNISADADKITNAYLYMDGAIVASVYDITLPGNEKTAAVGTGRNNYSNIESPVTVEFTFKPHFFGVVPAYVVLATDEENIIVTEEVEVTIEEEKVESSLDMASNGTTSTGLLSLNWNNSESVNLYTSEILSDLGLKAGDKIESISFKGYKSTDEYTTDLNVWYEFTDDTKQTQPVDGLYTTEGMTNALSETHTWKKEGSAEELVDMIVVNFNEPIVYEEGKSLRVVVRSESTSYKQAYFENSTVSGTDLSYTHKNDNHDTFASNSWSSLSYLPAIHLGLAVEPVTFSGTVVDEETNEPIEGATVFINNYDNNIEYNATTDADGKFTINVIQNTLAYTVYIVKDNYDPYYGAEELNFSEGNVEKSFALQPINVTVEISEVGVATLYYSNKNLEVPEGVTAYTATIEGTQIVKSVEYDIIPKDCAVIIEGAPGKYTFKSVDTESEKDAANLLLGTDEATTTYYPNATEGYKFYKLANGKSYGLGFYFAAENGAPFTNEAHKAYLAVKAESAANAYTFTPTGISVVSTDIPENAQIYNLSGIRMNKTNLPAGIYIVNGKKVVIK